MDRFIKDYLPVTIILLVCIFAFFRLMKSRKKKDYLFFGSSFLLFIVVYLICISEISITGNMLAIQKARQEIDKSKKEIIETTSGLIKIAYIVADGSGRIGGMPESHLTEIKAIQDSLKLYLDKDLNSQIDSLLLKLNIE